MDRSPDSPPDNQLPPAITAEQVESAIEQSGYPLQTVVALALREAGFDPVHEEWVYVDADSGDLRALDLRARRRLYEHTEPQRRVRPALELLIECKRSELPYVFFSSDNRPPGGAAVHVIGLHEDEITITTDDSLSTWGCPVIEALGLDTHPFVAEPPRVALAFSKVVRKGKDLVLSGVEAYQGLVLPLVKAGLNLAEQEAPVSTAIYHDLGLPVKVAVLDAPMVLATVTGRMDHELVPWVRVYRHDVDRNGERHRRASLHAIDCVHRAWLGDYLTDFLLPFADEFGVRSVAHDEEIATGLGFAPGMELHWTNDIASRLRPRPSGDVMRRAVQAVRRTINR